MFYRVKKPASSEAHQMTEHLKMNNKILGGTTQGRVRTHKLVTQTEIQTNHKPVKHIQHAATK